MISLLATALLASSLGTAAADTSPPRPLPLVVRLDDGAGGLDRAKVARTLAQELGRELVEPGAAGAQGWESLSVEASSRIVRVVYRDGSGIERRREVAVSGADDALRCLARLAFNLTRDEALQLLGPAAPAADGGAARAVGTPELETVQASPEVTPEALGPDTWHASVGLATGVLVPEVDSSGGLPTFSIDVAIRRATLALAVNLALDDSILSNSGGNSLDFRAGYLVDLGPVRFDLTAGPSLRVGRLYSRSVLGNRRPEYRPGLRAVAGATGRVWRSLEAFTQAGLTASLGRSFEGDPRRLFATVAVLGGLRYSFF